MRMLTLSSNTFLDNYILNSEFSKKAGISSNAYRYWKGVIAAAYDGSRTVFLLKSSVLKKYQNVANLCTNLSGLVPSNSFCAFTGLSNSHLIKSNRSKLYEKLHVKIIDGVKFVNLQRFYDDLGLSYDYHIYIEKCCYFSPEPLEKKIRLTNTMCVGYY